MLHIYNRINFNNLSDNKFYQVDYKQAYIKKSNNNVYIYSYDTCILQYDLTNKILYDNQNKYSQTTSKQKNQILRMITNNTSDFIIKKVIPLHKKYGYYTDLTLAKLN